MAKIVCICGSTRFWDEIQSVAANLTLAGHIVLQPNVNAKTDRRVTDAMKDDLDRLHRDKIKLCDEIMVVNQNGYVGDSTKREIAYAIALNRGVKFTEPESGAQLLRNPTRDLAAMIVREQSWRGSGERVDELAFALRRFHARQE